MLLDEPVSETTPQLVLLREFRDEESLRELISLLQEVGIDTFLHDSSSGFDVTFAYNKTTQFWQIWVDQSNEEKAKLICKQFDEEIVAQLTDDYYLFSFSNKELLDIINHPEAWSSVDLMLAQKLLDKNGIPVDSEVVEHKIQLSKASLDESDSVPQYVITLGYVLSIIGGAFGLAIAMILIFSKKTTSDGNRIHRFDKASRTSAYIMILVFLIVFVISGGVFMNFLLPHLG